ncbi:MAG TPA: hypothetical protein VH643_30755 [Gemmataceae bacterium]
MSRCLGVAIVGLLLSAAAGCTLDSFLSPSIVVDGPKTVVTGSVSQVAAKLQDGLSDAGIEVYPIKRVGSHVRVAGIKNTQTVFCLYLSEKKASGANKTLVRMKWDRGGDEELWQTVLKILATPASAAGASAENADGSSLSGRDQDGTHAR